MESRSAAPLSSHAADGIDPPYPVTDDPNTRREEGGGGMELLRASKGALRRFDSATLALFARRGEIVKGIGEMPVPPPLELVDYPEFFERAWGWDFLIPYEVVTPVPLYKIYLRQYYIRNHQRETNTAGADDLGLDGDGHGNGLLASLANSCIAMEDRLMLEWNRRAKSFTIDDDDEKEVPLVSNNITKRVREMAQVSESEFPAAAIALKCITKEAELLCQGIICQNFILSFVISNTVRQCALSCMTCKDYVPAAATMMGIMKEAERMIEVLKGDKTEKFARIHYADHLRRHAMLILLKLCDEHSPVAKPTVGDIAGDLSSNESENELAYENGNHEERGNVNENKALYDESDEKNSKKELARNDVDERNRTDENQNPNVKLGRNSLEEDKVKPDTKVDITGDLSFSESKNEVAGENDNHEERGNVNENKNSKKELARNDVDGRNRTDENQNPNVELGRNSVDKVRPHTKAEADTEKRDDLVGSSNEGYKSPFRQKLYELLAIRSPPSGKAGGRKKSVGCFNLSRPERKAHGPAS